MISQTFLNTLSQVESHSAEREEALFLLENSEDEDAAAALMASACIVRDKNLGKSVKMTGGIASVLKCQLRPNCIYCPYWRELNKAPLSISEILRAVEYLTSHGIRDFHLSGGTTLGSDGSDMLAIVRAINDAGYKDVQIDVNCGAAMNLETLKELKTLNVKMVRSVFETLNPVVFRTMKPGDSIEAKKEFAEMICDAGIGLGTGMLAGLSPQETKYKDYVDFLFEIKKYPNLKSLYISKFVNFDTIVLKGHPDCSYLEAARVMAVARLVFPKLDITGAQGWFGPGNKKVTPLEAGGGNSVLGIHINRVPAYVDTAAKKASGICEYSDGLEFMNQISSIEKQYRDIGMSIEY